MPREKKSMLREIERALVECGFQIVARKPEKGDFYSGEREYGKFHVEINDLGSEGLFSEVIGSRGTIYCSYETTVNTLNLLQARVDQLSLALSQQGIQARERRAYNRERDTSHRILERFQIQFPKLVFKEKIARIKVICKTSFFVDDAGESQLDGSGSVVANRKIEVLFYPDYIMAKEMSNPYYGYDFNTLSEGTVREFMEAETEVEKAKILYDLWGIIVRRRAHSNGLD